MQFYPSIKLSVSRPPATELEISGLFDGLSAIEELAPETTLAELLSASWGLPIVAPPQPVRQSPMIFAVVVFNSMVTSLRQIFGRVQAG
jgi:hypothetical protein